MVSLIHLLFLSLAKPYKQISEDYFAAGTSFALVCVFATCILFQMDELYEAVEDNLSEEFQDRFNPSTLALPLPLVPQQPKRPERKAHGEAYSPRSIVLPQRL